MRDLLSLFREQVSSTMNSAILQSMAKKNLATLQIIYLLDCGLPSEVCRV